jgi:hypothetical protein
VSILSARDVKTLGEAQGAIEDGGCLRSSRSHTWSSGPFAPTNFRPRAHVFNDDHPLFIAVTAPLPRHFGITNQTDLLAPVLSYLLIVHFYHHLTI